MIFSIVIGLLSALPAFIVRYVFKKQFTTVGAGWLAFLCCVLSFAAQGMIHSRTPAAGALTAVIAFYVLRGKSEPNQTLVQKEDGSFELKDS